MIDSVRQGLQDDGYEVSISSVAGSASLGGLTTTDRRRLHRR